MNRVTRVLLTTVAAGMLVAGAWSTAAAESLECKTNRRNYKPGRPVRIECTNHGARQAVTGSSFLVTAGRGVPIYNPAFPAGAVTVPPGGRVEYTWDQTYLNSDARADGGQVPRGRYAVSVQNAEPTRFWVGARGRDRRFVTLARGSTSGASTEPGGRNLVIRDQAAWSSFWEEHSSNLQCLAPPCPQLQPPKVDFDSEMVLVALHGPAPTGGHGVAFRKVRGPRHRLRARILNTSPGRECFTAQTVTNPYHFVVTPIADEVVFRERSKVMDCDIAESR